MSELTQHNGYAKLMEMAESLDAATRIGVMPDEPEGSVCIHISDTSAKTIAADLRLIAISEYGPP